MENTKSIQIELAYRGRKVDVHLTFSEGQDDKNARDFYDGLRKIYMEKEEFRSMLPGGTRI